MDKLEFDCNIMPDLNLMQDELNKLEFESLRAENAQLRASNKMLQKLIAKLMKAAGL